MSESGQSDERPHCTKGDVGESIQAYCFGDISGQDRDRFEAHLLECDYCWQEVRRLDALTSLLRSDKTLTRHYFAPDIVSMLGVSSNVHKFLAGNWIHASVASAIYASIIAISIFMEIAYQYDRYATLACWASPPTFLWLALGFFCALAADWKLTQSGRNSGLVASVGCLIVAATLQYTVLRPFLPDYSVTQATFQTWTAQAAYMKGVIYAVLFTAVFALVPFHFVVAMQRELQNHRYQTALALLTNSGFSIAPTGSFYLKSWLLGAFLILGAVYTLLSTAHLLEALKETEYSNLFIHTIQIRWLLFLGLGLECLAWYHAALNELKRECALLLRLEGRTTVKSPMGPSSATLMK